MAHLSGDAGLIEAFTSGEDLHTFVASQAFDLPTEQVDPELRRRIKAMSYGLAYGLSRVRPRAAAEASRRTRRASRWTPTSPASAGSATTCAGVVDAGAQGRLHRDDPRPPPLPARPHQRQRAAPADGRADGAQRADPGQRRRHHQGRDARRAARPARQRAAIAAAAAGARRAGARGRAGRARRRRGAGPPRDGRRLPARRCRSTCRVGVGRTWDDAGH